MAKIDIRNLTFSYPDADRLALDDVSFSINKGEYLAVCGSSGCGKTTVLRHLKSALTPFGNRSGEILYNGRRLEDVNLREQSSEIGYVLQSPENQIVTDKVWHELAFGLESLGYDNQTIRLRVAEMASYFGIQDWFHKNVTELSGGQKQLLNLASVMALQPQILILDEPTSQLDPIAASDFLSTIKKINQELGTSIVISEHRLEEVLPAADRAIVMEDGRVIAQGKPGEIGPELKKKKNRMFAAMPAPIQICSGVGAEGNWPVTVREGRLWLDQYTADRIFPEPEPVKTEEKKKKFFFHSIQKKKEEVRTPLLSVREVWFKYDRTLPDVIKNLSFDIYKGEMFCLVGGNGTGKSTTLSLVSGLKKPYRGKITLKDRKISDYKSKELYQEILGVMPQNPQTLFVKQTAEFDLYEMLQEKDFSPEEKDARVDEVIALTHLEKVLGQHPYDLSGGEQQRLALAKILLMKPEILILDEPTKGLDPSYKKELGGILKRLQQEKGTTVVMVSHDIEFCAEFADRCGLFFDGSIVTTGSSRQFFSGNSFYTTAANRMCRSFSSDIVTVEDAVARLNEGCLKKEVEEEGA
ncbi:MAG: ABC transporter ATP-binding protein [Eubacteriaceae bacterium]|jgi:energy-coupling factor transporter ATP-binding protein EcfA2